MTEEEILEHVVPIKMYPREKEKTIRDMTLNGKANLSNLPSDESAYIALGSSIHT